MKRLAPCDPYTEGKLLGIMLAGVLGHTRPECGSQARLRAELGPTLKPSGLLQLVRSGDPGIPALEPFDASPRRAR